MDKPKSGYIASISEHFDEIPWMKSTADFLHIRTGYIAIAILISAFALVTSGRFDALICNFIGTVYPAYLSFKAIETPETEDDKQWLTYWVVFSVYSVVDDFTDVLLFWLPFYYVLKLGVLVWLVWPRTRGALFIYEMMKLGMSKFNHFIGSFYPQPDTETVSMGDSDSTVRRPLASGNRARSWRNPAVTKPEPAPSKPADRVASPVSPIRSAPVRRNPSPNRVYLTDKAGTPSKSILTVTLTHNNSKLAIKLSKSSSYQPLPHILSSLSTWPGLTLSPLYLTPQLPTTQDSQSISLSDFVHGYAIDPVAALRSLSSSLALQAEEQSHLEDSTKELEAEDEEEKREEFSCSGISDAGGDVSSISRSWSKNTSKYRVFSLLKSIADASDWDLPNIIDSSSLSQAGMPSPHSLCSFTMEDLPSPEDEKPDNVSAMSSGGDIDEGQAGVAMRVFLQGTASHNRLKSCPVVLFKVPPKVVADASIHMVSFSFASVQEPVGRDPIGSPLYRRLCVCRPTTPAHAEVCYASAFTGYLTALNLEFSNLEGASKATVAYDREKLDFTALFYSATLAQLVTKRVVWVSCGQEHCLAVTAGGQVCTWGNGSSGCLGHGDRAHRVLPNVVERLSEAIVVYGDCGAYHTAIVTSEGELWTWGRGDALQLGLSISKLSRDEVGCMSATPQLVSYFPKRNLTVKFVASGEAHLLALDSMGTVHSCGWSEEGQVGRPTASHGVQSCRLGRVSLPSTDPIVKVAAGSLHSAALSQAGKVYVWGNGKQGQLGLGNGVTGSRIPVVMDRLDDKFIVDIVSGESSMICLAADNSVYGWGKGLAGNFSSTVDDSTAESQFPKGSEVVCFMPRLLGELQSPQRFMMAKWTEKTKAEGK